MPTLKKSGPNEWRRPVIRAVGMLAIVMGSLGLSGCVAKTQAGYVDLFVEKAPMPVLLPRHEVMPAAAEYAARREGDFVLRGVGNSMEPVYRSGTVLVVHPTAMHMLRKGLPVVYTNSRGVPVSHMLLERVGTGWRTIGLNNEIPDATLVTERNLIGVIKAAFAPDDLAIRVRADRRVAAVDRISTGPR